MHKPIPWTIADILNATGGKLLRGSTERAFERVSIDSRTIGPGDLFTAIRGHNHDGHAFVNAVVDQGCRGVLIEKTQTANLTTAKNVICIAVADTTRALGDLAASQRRRANARVIAVTGSNGKTSTKEFMRNIFSQAYPTLATEGNLNNHIGLPLTLLELGYHHQVAVVELGMNRAGEIRTLARICRPDVGVITNIGPAHLEGLGSMDGVMQAKGELVPEISSDGFTILNADDSRVMQLAPKAPAQVVLFGMASRADIRAEAVTPDARGHRFRLVTPAGHADIHLQLPGEFMVTNALAAAAAAWATDTPLEIIKKGLEQSEAVNGRMNILQTPGGATIIDDTYNANPASMKEAITTLKSLKGSQRGFLVLGNMAELGAATKKMHADIGALAAASGADRLYTTGDLAEDLARGARNGGMHPDQIFVDDKASIIQDLRRHLESGDWVMVKGSRSMNMEKIVQGLMEPTD
jgi:UDP-N-acetylmuramoyl-tripeptide--D-alanyl-D-alanine ligase